MSRSEGLEPHGPFFVSTLESRSTIGLHLKRPVSLFKLTPSNVFTTPIKLYKTLVMPTWTPNSERPWDTKQQPEHTPNPPDNIPSFHLALEEHPSRELEGHPKFINNTSRTTFYWDTNEPQKRKEGSRRSARGHTRHGAKQIGGGDTGPRTAQSRLHCTIQYHRIPHTIGRHRVPHHQRRWVLFTRSGWRYDTEPTCK